MAAGAYPSLPPPIFGGLGGVSMVGSGGLLAVGGGNLIIPASNPHAMFGRGVDVIWKIAIPMRRFGGLFRLPNGSPGTTTATFTFFDASFTPIGLPQTIAINNTSWTPAYWMTFPKWSYVLVTGNGSLPGYVGHDNIKVRWF